MVTTFFVVVEIYTFGEQGFCGLVGVERLEVLVEVCTLPRSIQTYQKNHTDRKLCLDSKSAITFVQAIRNDEWIFGWQVQFCIPCSSGWTKPIFEFFVKSAPRATNVRIADCFGTRYGHFLKLAANFSCVCMLFLKVNRVLFSYDYPKWTFPPDLEHLLVDVLTRKIDHQAKSVTSTPYDTRCASFICSFCSVQRDPETSFEFAHKLRRQWAETKRRSPCRYIILCII